MEVFFGQDDVPFPKMFLLCSSARFGFIVVIGGRRRDSLAIRSRLVVFGSLKASNRRGSQVKSDELKQNVRRRAVGLAFLPMQLFRR